MESLPPRPSQPKLSYPTLAGILWTCVAITYAFVVFRMGVRVRAFRRLFWDDGLVFFAWLSFLGSAIAWQVEHVGIYLQFWLTSGKVAPTVESIATFVRGERIQLAIHILYLVCLWAVKLSFLIFFRRLGNKVRGQKVWWWTVTGILIATFIIAIGLLPYPCLMNDAEYIFYKCDTYASLRDHSIRLYIILALDITTDFLIMSIPVSILWNIQIPLRQKLGLIGIFSLTIIIMVFAIVRVAVVNSMHKQWDVTWLHFWTFMEMAVAIVISCVASFRQLFVHSERSVLPICTRSATRPGLNSAPNSPTSPTSRSGTHTTTYSKEQGRPSSSDSEEENAPVKNIHIVHVETGKVVKERGGGYVKTDERPISWSFMTALSMGFVGQRF